MVAGREKEKDERKEVVVRFKSDLSETQSHVHLVAALVVEGD